MLKIVLNKRFTYYSFLLLTSSVLCACNLFSTRNIHNDFRWKNKKFDTPLAVELEYTLELLTDIANAAFFFEGISEENIDKTFNVQSFLIEKFKKRNIFCNTASNDLKIRIDKLIFKGFSESVAVYSNHQAEYLGNDHKDFFIFEIRGSLFLNGVYYSEVSTNISHNTEPRESYVFSGHIAYGGINAEPKIMVENAINEFSFRTYLKVKEVLKNK